MVNDAEHIGGIHALGSLGEVGEVNKVKILAGHVGNNLRSGQAELVENELGFRSGSALSGGLHVLAEFLYRSVIAMAEMILSVSGFMWPITKADIRFLH